MALAGRPKEVKQKNRVIKEKRPPLYLVVNQDQEKIQRRKRAPGKKRSNRLAMLVTLAMVMVLTGPVIVNIHQCYILGKELSGIKNEHSNLLQIQEQLKKELDYLDTQEAIEKLAREKLGMIIPGETMVKAAIAQDGIPEREKVKQGDVNH